MARWGEYDVLVTPTTARAPIPADGAYGRSAAVAVNTAGHFTPFSAVFNLLKAGPGDAPSLTGESPLRPILGPNSVLTSVGERHLRRRRMLLAPFHGEAVQSTVSRPARCVIASSSEAPEAP